MTSIGLLAGVALLFTPSRAVNVALQISARKLSNGTTHHHLKAINPSRKSTAKPLVRIKKTELTHRTHSPESIVTSDAHKFSSPLFFFEVPYIFGSTFRSRGDHAPLAG